MEMVVELPTLSDYDLGWLVGWIEGEGSFSALRQNGYVYPQLVITSSDRDTIDRAAKLMEAKVYNIAPTNKGTRMYSVAIVGKKAAGWMLKLAPLMSERRKWKIEQVLVEYIGEDWIDIPEGISQPLDKNG